MARPIWTGSLAFGLVNVPVALYAATEDKTIHFNQFQAGTSDRIRYKRINERTGREVDLSDIVRGHEVGKGDYVLLTDEELEAAEPGRSRTIEITDFVDLDEIDPIYFQRTYYLAPQPEGAGRAYMLLRQAMADTGKAGIATFVLHGKQHLVAIRPEAELLVLETMFFADEIRDPGEEIKDLPDGREFRGRELTIAKQLIQAMATAWDPSSYRDTYRERVADLIERKRRGEEIVTEGAPAQDSNIVDLLEALRASAAAARGRDTSARSPATPHAGKDEAARPQKSASRKRDSRKAASKSATSRTGTHKQSGKAPAVKGRPGRKKAS